MMHTIDFIYRHPKPGMRPQASDILVGIQRPDFILLRWSTNEIDLYSEVSRTLGTPLENGQCLHKDLQDMYLISSDKNKMESENTPNNFVYEGVSNNNHEWKEGSKEESED